MKVGFSEIILLLIITAVVLIVFRGIPTGANIVPLAFKQPTPEEMEEARIKNGRGFRLRALGGVFLVTGILILASILKIFDILFTASAGGVLLLLFGVVILFLSARK